MITFNRIFPLILLLILGLISACSNENTPKNQSEQTEEAMQNSETENALVLVNGIPIYQSDVEEMIERTFSQSDQLLLNDDIQSKVLESLITSKAIMQKAKKELSEQEVVAIQKRVQSFEEELYVKSYLQEHAVPQPVTNEMVEKYYAEHPERFGGSKLKTYEMLRANQKLSEAQRDKLLSEVEKIKQTKEWSSIQDQWKQTLSLSYLRGEVRAGLFGRTIDQQMASLKEGEVSNVIFVDEVPYLIRIVKEKMLPPKPLSEVSSEIRKTLVPLQLRKAVKDVSVKVLDRTDIQHQTPSDSSN
jgi:hypothetical protein